MVDAATHVILPTRRVIEVRTITKPVAGTVKVYLDSVEQLSGWSIDTTTGLVTFGMPPEFGRGTAGFECDVPVRFDTDHMAEIATAFVNWQDPMVMARSGCGAARRASGRRATFHAELPAVVFQARCRCRPLDKRSA